MFDVLIAVVAMAACLRIGYRSGRRRGVEDTVQNAIRVSVTQPVEAPGDTIILGNPVAGRTIMVLRTINYEGRGRVTADFQDEESWTREHRVPNA